MTKTYLAAAGMLGVLQRRATSAYSQGAPYRKKNYFFLILRHIAIIRYSFNTENVHHYNRITCQ